MLIMNKSNTIICSAKKCYSSLLTHPCKSFFGFPTDVSLCKIWLENCERTDVKPHQVSKSRHWRLCEDHFEDKWFTDNSKKILRRKLNPVPTIFHNNISSLLPAGVEPDVIDDYYTLNPLESLQVELVEEGDDLCSDSLDAVEPSVKNKSLPISYYSNQLLKSVDFQTETVTKTLLNLNPDIELLNVDQMCRFCLKNISQNYIEMFSQTDDAKEIRKISEIILPNKISVGDGLPHKVCEQCTMDLKTCWRLVERFQNADQYLRSVAKHSSFTDNENTRGTNFTKEEVEGVINFDGSTKQVSNNSVVLPLSPFEKTLEDSYLNEADLEIKDSLNLCRYVVTSHNSDDPVYNWQERNIREDKGYKISSNLKKRKKSSNNRFKLSKKCKKVPQKKVNNQIIVMAQDHVNQEQGLLTAPQTTSFRLFKPIEKFFAIGNQSIQCSEHFDSNSILEKHS